jgi:sensor histidine kinase YesM
MKRLILHFTFWVAYLIQDALLEYLWLGPSLKNISENNQLWMAFEAALVILIPKLLFTYYVMYIAISRILREKSRHILIAAEIFFFLLVSIILYRIIFNYYIFPNIYSGIIKIRPLFDGRLVLLALMDIGFVSGAAITFKLLRKQLIGKEREKSLVKEKLETELKFLRNQTNPHFLFNTLNNIYGLARRKSDDTAEIVLKLSKLLRFMIYESKKDLISIAEEMKMLDDYIELERIRYNSRLKINFKKEIDNNAQQITPLLLLPLIENAFKHGVSESLSDSYIHIEAVLQQSNLNFEISNSKEPGNNDPTSYNIGLGNLKRQLELIYKEHNLLIENNHNIFKVHLFINLKSYEKV